VGAGWFAFAISVAIAAAGIGCTTSPEQREAEIARVAARNRLIARGEQPITCNSPDECEAMWGRLNSLVSSCCDFKIQTSSAFLIETYGPMQGDAILVACKALRIETDETSTMIKLSTYCGRPCDQALYAQAVMVEDVLAFRDSMRTRSKQ